MPSVEAERPGPEGHGGGRILVVEDEPDIARLTRRYLERAGYEVRIAATGAAALKAATAERPDLVTLDIQLPDVDGLTVLEWLKSNAATRDIPIVLVSVLPDDGEAARLGAVSHLAKPVDERVLIEQVRRVLGGPSATVLVAAADARRPIAGHLRWAGYGVLETAEGTGAVALAARERPDVVLLDAEMPGTDGVLTLRELRANAATSDLPVIVMTANPGVMDRRRAEVDALGAALLVVREPFCAADLVTTIARVLAGRTPA